MINYIMAIIAISLIVLILSSEVARKRKQKPQPEFYESIEGLLKGETHTADEWRKIALEIVKKQKDIEAQIELEHATGERLFGMIYLKTGIDLKNVNK